MKQKTPIIEGRREDGYLHYVRLMALLQELERDHGRKEAAAILGVDPRTLDAGLDERVLSRRMRAALDKALRAGMGSDANDLGDHADELEARLDGLKDSMKELGREIGDRCEAVEAQIRALREERERAQLEAARDVHGER